MSTVEERPRVVVCGTKFGRIYLAAFRDAAFPFTLAGILARGSERSRACADAYGVPLFTEPAAVPADVDVACVVVGAGVNGGPGAELARALMARGIHVLQEHPLHEGELAECLREAGRRRVVYHLNTHYVHIEPVRRFILTARALFRRQPPRFIDAACGIQTAFTLWDILGEALGGLRPWTLADPAPVASCSSSPDDAGPAFRSLTGTVAGVPLTLRIQADLDPRDPDNHIHLMHRITVGTDGGTLTLVSTHGPVVWSPRAHLPADARHTVTIDESKSERFDLAAASPIGPPEAPTYREIVRSIWPAGVQRALMGLWQAVGDPRAAHRRGQYHLTVCRAWHDATRRVGPPVMSEREPPPVLAAADLSAAAFDHG